MENTTKFKLPMIITGIIVLFVISAFAPRESRIVKGEELIDVTVVTQPNLVINPNGTPQNNTSPLSINWDPGRFGSYYSNVKIDMFKNGTFYGNMVPSAPGWGNYTYNYLHYFALGTGYQVRLTNLNTGATAFSAVFEIY